MVTLTSTVEEAKVWLRGNFDKGACCPVCRQFVKLYRRKLNSAMAYSLILVDRYFRKPDAEEWLHTPTYMRSMKARDRDMGYLKYWELIEEKPAKRDDGGKHAGYYKITDLGKEFVARRARVKKYLFLYNGELVSRPDERSVDIVEALGSRFNYQELMENV
jgi:hypothetical protein